MENSHTKLTKEQALKLARNIMEQSEYEGCYLYNKKYKSNFRKVFAPIIPDFPTIQKWIPNPLNKSEIIGTWAEDGLRYVIDCPYQIRDLLIFLQNILPDLANLIEKNLSEKE